MKIACTVSIAYDYLMSWLSLGLKMILSLTNWKQSPFPSWLIQWSNSERNCCKYRLHLVVFSLVPIPYISRHCWSGFLDFQKDFGETGVNCCGVKAILENLLHLFLPIQIWANSQTPSFYTGAMAHA